MASSALQGIKLPPSITLGQSLTLQLCAGASFFYEQGTIPYEAQEARAFGLFLADLLARTDPQDEESMASSALHGIKAACLNPVPSERPAFQQIASHCHSVLKVRACTAN